MGLTWSNSGLFSAPGFIVSAVGKGERTKKKKKRRWEGGKNRIEKEWKEERKEEGIKTDQRKDKKTEFYQKYNKK